MDSEKNKCHRKRDNIQQSLTTLYVGYRQQKLTAREVGCTYSAVSKYNNGTFIERKTGCRKCSARTNKDSLEKIVKQKLSGVWERVIKQERN